MERDGETELVNLDPRDHGKLERDMVRDNRFLCSVLMIALGVSVLLYCAALGWNRIRRWLVSIAAKDSRKLENPDYLPDLVILGVLPAGSGLRTCLCAVPAAGQLGADQNDIPAV